MTNFVIVLLLAWIVSVYSADKYLYLDDSDAKSIIIEHTDESDFGTSTRPRVVEFYSPFCGGCIAFKPKYIALARETMEKDPEIEFFAVSCAAHKETCDQYKINGYPSIFTFPKNSKEGLSLKRSKNPFSDGYNSSDILKALGSTNVAKDGRILVEGVERKEFAEKIGGTDENDEDVTKEEEKEVTEETEGGIDQEEMTITDETEGGTDKKKKEVTDEAEDVADEEELEVKDENEGGTDEDEKDVTDKNEGATHEEEKDVTDKTEGATDEQEMEVQDQNESETNEKDEKVNKEDANEVMEETERDTKEEEKKVAEEIKYGADALEGEEIDQHFVDSKHVEEANTDDKGHFAEMSALSLKKASSLSGMGQSSRSKLKALKVKYAKERNISGISSAATGTEAFPSTTTSTTTIKENEPLQPMKDNDDDKEKPEQQESEQEEMGEQVDNDEQEVEEGLEVQEGQEVNELQDDEVPAFKTEIANEGDHSMPDKEEELPQDYTSMDSSVTSYRTGLSNSVHRVPGAGAELADPKTHDMDKWHELLVKRKARFQSHGAKAGTFSRVFKLKGVKHPELDKPAVPGSTTIMLANTPGTQEFNEKRKRTLDRIEIYRKKREGSFLRRTKPMTIEMQKELLMKKNFPFKVEPSKPSFVRKQGEKLPIIKHIFTMSTEEELILDASLSFVIGLRHGIFMSNEPLSEKKKTAFKRWLDLLSVGLPPEWGLHTLIDDLSQNIDYVSSKDTILYQVLDKHPLPRKKWSKSCENTGTGGFSCGMWKLLHTMTIGMAEHRGGRNLIDAKVVDSTSPVFSPADAADIIREYIAHFFGCKDCRDHFLAQYDQCSFRRCDRLTDDANTADAEDWKQLALWLWEVHNDVSVRVSTQKVSRVMKKQKSLLQNGDTIPVMSKEDEIQALWPTIEGCLACFDENGKWNEASVFAFLERTYWSEYNEKTDRQFSALNVERDTSGGGLIWFMLLVAIFIVLSLRSHLNKSSGLRRTFTTVSAISNKLTDKVAGKQTEKKN